MLFVFLAILLVIFCVGIYKYNHSKYGSGEEAACCAMVLSGLLGVIVIITIIVQFTYVIDSRYVDDKIAMYMAENEAIEADIGATVESFMAHEDKTFAAASGRSPITLVTMFPELKSDALVAKQIEVYVANNNAIKDLKLQGINYKSSKWWLYFGG